MNRNFNVGAIGAALIFGLAFCVPTMSQTRIIPDSKIAVIYSEMFMDSKAGIARFGSVVEGLNREFQPRKTELETLQQKAKALEDEIIKTGSIADPNTIRTKSDQLDQMKRDLQRKAEDAQAAYDKRKKDVFAPLQNDIGKALDAYAKSHNINLIIDAAQVPLIYAADAIDITRDFINDFNAKNPATSSPPK